MFSAENNVPAPRPIRLRHRLKTAARALGLAALAFLLCVPASAQSKEEREYAIKAGFLYNFFSYVDWPARAQDANPSVFVIGIVGENSFGAAMDALKGKSVKGRKIEIRQVKDLTQLSEYHLLFVPAAEQSRIRDILEKTKNNPTLTVGEAPGFIQEGGVINLVPARNRIQIEINPAAAERAGLTISSQLLKLAQIVRG